MSVREDSRGQAIQVGAVLLFAILILAFSTYQAVIIPGDNRRVEFNHNQEVQERLADLRNAVLSTATRNSPESVTIPLGTRYPSRTLGLNPGPPGGTVRTVGTDEPSVNISISNATVPGETGDFWDGSARAYATGGFEYDPRYNRYTEAPRTVYEQSVLYNRFTSGTLVLANQTLVNGNRLSIVTLSGSLSRTSDGAMTVDVRPISTSRETVVVGDAGSNAPITLTFASRLPVSRWEQILSDEDNVVDVSGAPSPTGSEFNGIRVELRTGEEYRLQMTKVAVGSGGESEPAAYLTDLAGDGATVARGSSQQVTLAVRDRYNNPVPGVTVNGAVAGPAGGSLTAAQQTTDAAGEVTFTYSASGTTTSGDKELRFSMGALGGTFDASTPENVSIDVAVPPTGTGDGDNPFAPTWVDPGSLGDNSDVALSACSADSCVWDVGASDGSTLRLNATSGLSAGFSIEFTSNNDTVGTVAPTTATTADTGTVSTVLTPSTNGTVDIAATSGGGGDLIEIAVENVTAGGQPVSLASKIVDQGQTGSVARYEVSYDVTGMADFDHVEVSVGNLDSNSANESYTSTDPRNNIDEYGWSDSKSGTGGDRYEITIEVYDTSGDVVTTRTVTDTADSTDPAGNDGLSEVDSPTLQSSSVTDQTRNNIGRYTVGYEGSDSAGRYSETEVLFLNTDSATTTDQRTGTNLAGSVFSSDGGAGDKYDIVVQVQDDDGIVVDQRTYTDTADGRVDGSDATAVSTQISNFDRQSNDDQFSVQAQSEDSDGDNDMDRMEYVIVDSNDNVVAVRTESGSGQQIQPGTIVIDAEQDVQESESYTAIVTGYDSDGNYHWATQAV